jgi:hypothetical protein
MLCIDFVQQRALLVRTLIHLEHLSELRDNWSWKIIHEFRERTPILLLPYE